MAMYHMAMPPHFVGGSHPPGMHSPMFPGPLLPHVNHSHGMHSFNPPPSQPIEAANTVSSQPVFGGLPPHLYPQQASVYVSPCVRHPNYYGYPANSTNMSNMRPLHQHQPHLQHSDCYIPNHRHQLPVDEELMEEMITLHLGYIDTEASTQKMEQREKLEGVILEYLAVTPSTRKFTHHEVSNVLEQSIKDNINFSAHRAANAFDALAQYAVNLISQPWRKEFREIKLYNGFWVHQIASHLVGAECILELMGYVRIKGKFNAISPSTSSPLKISPSTYVLGGVLDPDLISRLALDCMIAYCECQCLEKIHEGMSEYDLSMSQVLHYRKQFIGDVDFIVRHLLFTLRQQMYSARPPLGLDSPEEMNEATSPPPIPVRQSSNYSNSLHSCNTKALSHTSSHIDKTSSGTGVKTHPNSSKHLGPNSHLDVVDCAPKTSRSQSLGNPTPHPPPIAISHKEQGSSFPAPHTRSTDISTGSKNSEQVPTAKLIDLESSHDGSLQPPTSKLNHHLLPKVVPHRSSSKIHHSSHHHNQIRENFEPNLPEETFEAGTVDEHLEATFTLFKNPNRNSGLSSKLDSELNSFENWDFVYRGLERKGYHKDIGERGNILHDIAKQSISQDVSVVPRDSNLNNDGEASQNRQLTINQALQQLTLAETREEIDRPPSNRSSNSHSEGGQQRFRYHRNSLYDNVSGGFETAAQYSDEYEDRKALRKINNSVRADSKMDQGRNNCANSIRNAIFARNKEQLDYSNRILKPLNLPINEFNDTDSENHNWNCVTCTFINGGNRKSCEMCGKSKHPGPELKPLTSGGKQCPKCTLINDKDVQHCSACGSVLEGSSTYI